MLYTDFMFKKRIRLNTSKLSVVLYGALIGFLTGIVVSVFRWTIEKLLQFVQALYVDISHGNITVIFFLMIANFIGFLIVAWLLNKEPNISGSGIPQVEGLLLGELKINWWSTLWRKFISGIVAIGSGLMLGREGPSIQLGASIGQGVASYKHLSHNQSKGLIASGAAAGLSAAFNAPLAGVMFVLEESITVFLPLSGLVH